MPNVTFSSPALPRDLTVYAVAGDKRTLLAVAQEHKVPLHHECGNGECGSCIVQVQVLGSKSPIGVALTEKEKIVLRYNGKITAEEIEDADVNDRPPRYRLACQMIVRDEDIVVTF